MTWQLSLKSLLNSWRQAFAFEAKITLFWLTLPLTRGLARCQKSFRVNSLTLDWQWNGMRWKTPLEFVRVATMMILNHGSSLIR